MFRKFLQSWTEGSEIQIHAPYAGGLKFCDPLADGTRHERFNVFPILRPGIARQNCAWPAGQENGAIRGGFVLDMQAAFGLRVDRPTSRDGKAGVQ